MHSTADLAGRKAPCQQQQRRQATVVLAVRGARGRTRADLGLLGRVAHGVPATEQEEEKGTVANDQEKVDRRQVVPEWARHEGEQRVA
eukprot:2306824-Pleurochrysis_carterae.AAC.1